MFYAKVGGIFIGCKPCRANRQIMALKRLCAILGEIKEIIKNAILDGEIPNDYDAAHALMEKLAAERGLKKR